MLQAVKDDVVRLLLQELQEEVEELRVRLTRSAPSGTMVFIGTYPGTSHSDLPEPVGDTDIRRVALLDQQGPGYGDEIFIDGRKGDGTKHWTRIAGFTDT